MGQNSETVIYEASCVMAFCPNCKTPFIPPALAEKQQVVHVCSFCSTLSLLRGPIEPMKFKYLHPVLR